MTFEEKPKDDAETPAAAPTDAVDAPQADGAGDEPDAFIEAWEALQARAGDLARAGATFDADRIQEEVFELTEALLRTPARLPWQFSAKIQTFKRYFMGPDHEALTGDRLEWQALASLEADAVAVAHALSIARSASPVAPTPAT